MRVLPEDYEWDENRLVQWVGDNWKEIFQDLIVSVVVFLLLQTAISPITHPNVQIASTDTEPDGEIEIRVENFGDQKSKNLILAIERVNDSWRKTEEIGSISPGEGLKRSFKLHPRTNEIAVFNHSLQRENLSQYRDMCNKTQNMTDNVLYQETDSGFERSSAMKYNENGNVLWKGTVVARWIPNREAESVEVSTEFKIVVETKSGEIIAREEIHYPGFGADNDDEGAPYPSSIILDKGVQTCEIKK